VHLLVVEDDKSIADPMVDGLSRAGFDVSRVATGQAALEAVVTYSPPIDMVLLDLGLPDLDGFDVCRQIRSRSQLPIVVVSARAEEVDRVIGLELGADDYIVKPFGFRELVARIRAVGRRTIGDPDAGPQQLGRLALDRRSHRVYVDGAEVALTPKEYDLLALLAEDPGAVITRQEILEEVWHSHWYGPTNSLDVHVASLRKKLGHPEWIETVRGVGLRLGAT
jgi:DNA-binding response OmpR family regulator